MDGKMDGNNGKLDLMELEFVFFMESANEIGSIHHKQKTCCARLFVRIYTWGFI